MYPTDPIGTALANYVAGRADNVTAVVYDIITGQTVVFRPGVVEHTASTVKVDILGTLLDGSAGRRAIVTPQEQMLAVPMIEEVSIARPMPCGSRSVPLPSERSSGRRE